jgi:hypothetical protein
MPMCCTQRQVVSRDQKKSDNRANRYRSLARAAGENATAKLLYVLADEAERGVLCTADWLSDAKRRAVGTKLP